MTRLRGLIALCIGIITTLGFAIWGHQAQAATLVTQTFDAKSYYQYEMLTKSLTNYPVGQNVTDGDMSVLGVLANPIPSGTTVTINVSLDGTYSQQIPVSLGNFTAPYTGYQGHTFVEGSSISYTVTTTGSYDMISIGDLSSAQIDYGVTKISVTYAAPLVPSPTGLATSNISQNSIGLSWSPVSGATTYKVYQDGVLLGTTSTTSYTAAGLTSGTNYNYYVVAEDSQGDLSANSSSVSAQTLLSAASGLSMSSVTDSGGTLAWSTVSGATGYNVYLNDSEIGKASGTSYTFSGLSASTSYTAYVQPYDASGTGPKSASIVWTTAALPVLPNPTDVQTTGTPGGSGTITWTAPTTAPSGTTYIVSANGNPIGSTTGTSYDLSPYDPSTVYTVTASAPGYTSSNPVSQTTSISYSATPMDFLKTSLVLVASLASFILLGLVIYLIPRLITLLWTGIGRKKLGDYVDVGGERNLGYEPRENWSYSFDSDAILADSTTSKSFEGVESSDSLSSSSASVRPKSGYSEVYSPPVSGGQNTIYYT